MAIDIGQALLNLDYNRDVRAGRQLMADKGSSQDLWGSVLGTIGSIGGGLYRDIGWLNSN